MPVHLEWVCEEVVNVRHVLAAAGCDVADLADRSVGELRARVCGTGHEAIAGGPPASLADLATSHESLRLAREWLQERRPNWRRELELRAGPLRDQWLTMGPGFLPWLQRRFPETAWPTLTTITVHGLLPWFGGWGTAIPGEGRLELELLLTNRDDQPPELHRLAWLTTQVYWLADRPRTDPATSTACQLAAMLAFCWIADELEWCPIAATQIQRALRSWRVLGAEPPSTLGETLLEFTQRELSPLPSLDLWPPKLLPIVSAAGGAASGG